MSLSIETIASRISWSTSFSGRWSLISWWVRKPRVLPILMSVFSSWRRLATSSSVSWVSSRPNSRISARSLARLTFMRSGLALAARRPRRRPARPRDRPRGPTGRRRTLPAWRPCRRPCPSSPRLPLAATAPLPLATGSAAFAAGAGFFFGSTAAGLRLWRPGWRPSTGSGFLAVMRFLEGSWARRRRAQQSNCALSCGIQGRSGRTRSVRRAARPQVKRRSSRCGVTDDATARGSTVRSCSPCG